VWFRGLGEVNTGMESPSLATPLPIPEIEVADEIPIIHSMILRNQAPATRSCAIHVKPGVARRHQAPSHDVAQ
jgi:hypothetical protein